MVSAASSKKIPTPFILRRLHSLLGLWLALYLFEHLLVNSQVALYFYDQGASFIAMVNKIHQTPYLKAVEILFLGLPFVLHGWWGIAYAREAKLNSFCTDGKTASLPQYPRNRAFTWQRVTSWILLVAIIAHVVHMRFISYPEAIQRGTETMYLVKQKESPLLYKMQEPLHLGFYDQTTLQELPEPADRSLKEGELFVAAPSPGIAFLLVLRELFSHPLMVILYSIFVISACYHAYNGLWTAMLKWGVIATERAQSRWRAFTTTTMILVTGLGLFAAWGSYFL